MRSQGQVELSTISNGCTHQQIYMTLQFIYQKGVSPTYAYKSASSYLSAPSCLSGAVYIHNHILLLIEKRDQALPGVAQ